MHSHFKSVQIGITVFGLILLLVLIICHIYLKRPKIRDLVITMCTYIALYILYRGLFYLRKIHHSRKALSPAVSPAVGGPLTAYPTYTDYVSSNLPALRPMTETQILVSEAEEETIPPSYNTAVNEPVPSYRSSTTLSVQLSHNP
ncbi:hypothetical protein K493DRAFT_315944 [Basidiobolus meristosporus CBS 931.73]|uniref:Uncharacterized protein n=1 Tax=Basidiobolus meristosporus CBS 931.73 TaxID=1314790 RepID=A0A1Y1Y6Q9_9FUNG|nr:hypothetical protein K493DRAFT_315944 [Basidiobolus meristosporus CBS 931.73]|eukprot:ORX93575.1 hypothetical protein K493DRAFT_315944 [Basidiobolus meristosporus CBS 931.73]